eukprot:snap_masked-scaffold_20-processed-gene-4.18-mRNA-1 protein AED:1.00 eAED:1.00 QI:0/-1/0/0/-1/1/1/0/100
MSCLPWRALWETQLKPLLKKRRGKKFTRKTKLKQRAPTQSTRSLSQSTFPTQFEPYNERRQGENHSDSNQIELQPNIGSNEVKDEKLQINSHRDHLQESS